MLYEALTGDVPFDADSALTLFKKIDREPVVLEVDPEKGIDEAIRAIVMRCLEKKRDARYARATLLAEDLERYLGGKTPRAKPETAIHEVAKSVKQNSRAVIALAALLLIAPALLVLVLKVRAGRVLEARIEAVRREVEQRAA